VDRADRDVAARPEGRLSRRQRAVSERATVAQPGRPISGDLTRNDRSKQQWTGGPITGDLTGPETYGTIFSIAEALRGGPA
jgi:hypothetical protein